MKLLKKIYLNGEFVNQFECDGESANCELIALLLDKAKKRYNYKIDLHTDAVYREIRATLKFTHERDDKTTNTFVYEYNFTQVDRMIDLR